MLWWDHHSYHLCQLRTRCNVLSLKFCYQSAYNFNYIYTFQHTPPISSQIILHLCFGKLAQTTHQSFECSRGLQMARPRLHWNRDPIKSTRNKGQFLWVKMRSLFMCHNVWCVLQGSQIYFQPTIVFLFLPHFKLFENLSGNIINLSGRFFSLQL